MSKWDIGLAIIVSFILIFGFFVLNSAAPSWVYVERQLLSLTVALVTCAALVWLGKKHLIRYPWVLYLGSIGLLLLTRVAGREVYGARRWLELGFLPEFQPSEFAKLGLILVLAACLHEKPIRGIIDYLRLAILVLVPFALVFLEPDLGSALVLVAIGGGVLMVRGIPRRHFIVSLIVFAVIVPIAVPTVVWPNLQPHQRSRIITFLDPSADPRGSGYQVIQSRIAIGSGGLWGKGYGQGTQSQLGFIPASHTDFIYPVLAEEIGFLGAVALLALYGLLFWRLTVMISECPLERDRFIITGVLSLIGFQVLVNVGVALGLAPVTGITLPLVSYGGTSLLATLVALTLAFVVHSDRYAEW